MSNNSEPYQQSEYMLLQLTSDRSHTLFSTKAGQTYHSAEGAIMESLHVYVSPAFAHFRDKPQLDILEVGFGTGLNALLTMMEAEKTNRTVYYETIEPDPVPEFVYTRLNYPDELKTGREAFLTLHRSADDEPIAFPSFRFVKRQIRIEAYRTDRLFDVVYYDAFSPDAQPELWTREIFEHVSRLLHPGGILLTYSAKGTVKQALREAGFEVLRLPGAGSKHHMLKAIRKEEASNNDAPAQSATQ